MKFLLCRPRGGLNDTFCQIEFCWRYAELHNRFLIIDTEYLVSTGISIQFSKLFKTKNHVENVIFHMTPSLLNNLNQLSAFPTSCAGRLNNYKTRLDEHLKIVDNETGLPITFDFTKNYKEDLLIHDQFGGSGIGINCLARLKLTEKFRGDVLSTLSPLIGKTHIVVHVRHSDYQTNFAHAFKEIYEKSINQRLLICSDSLGVINFAKSFFDQSEVFTLSLPPDTGGIGLPNYATFYCNDEQRYELMVQAFADLIGLATGTKTIFCKLTPGEFGDAASKHQDFSTYSTFIRNNPTKNIGVNGFSGFSVLVNSVKKNYSIISQLLSD